jgi:hypothetical protein
MSEDKALPVALFPLEPINDLARAGTSGTSPLDGREVSPSIYMDAYIQKHPNQATDKRVAAGGAVLGTVGATALLNTVASPLWIAALGPAGIAAGAAAALIVGGNPSANKVCTLMIVNQLDGVLSLAPATDTVGNPYLHHGIQSGHPAVCDPAGQQPPFNEHQIPGKAQLDPDDADSLTCGVGFYRFEKDLSVMNLGVYGTAGAIAFTSSDPQTHGKVLALAWNVPPKGTPGCFVTGDLSKYPNLHDFYLSTVGQHDFRLPTFSKMELPGSSYSAAEYELHSHFAARDYDSASKKSASENDFILTLSVRKGK